MAASGRARSPTLAARHPAAARSSSAPSRPVTRTSGRATGSSTAAIAEASGPARTTRPHPRPAVGHGARAAGHGRGPGRECRDRTGRHARGARGGATKLAAVPTQLGVTTAGPASDAAAANGGPDAHVRHRRLHRSARGGPASSSRASSGSSTAATTRPGSRWSTTRATSSSRSAPASWPTSRRRSPTGRRTPRSASRTPAGRRTAGPNDLNAHPHQDCTGEITVIHNGIIENFRELRDGLEARGHTLTSETDTEAIAHLDRGGLRGRPRRGGPRRAAADRRAPTPSS